MSSRRLRIIQQYSFIIKVWSFLTQSLILWIPKHMHTQVPGRQGYCLSFLSIAVTNLTISHMGGKGLVKLTVYDTSL